jgi:hypothetical protein
MADPSIKMVANEQEALLQSTDSEMNRTKKEEIRVKEGGP